MEKVITWRAIPERLPLSISLNELVALTAEELRERGFDRTERWVEDSGSRDSLETPQDG